MTISAEEALERLVAGNDRYRSGNGHRDVVDHRARRRQSEDGQAPLAVVLGCSDSRVPPEIVFDQGLGDLFVVRVAGGVATPETIGSVEFAVGELGSRLVVVLGHTKCGAIAATLTELTEPSAELSPHLGAIVERIAPAVAAPAPAGLRGPRDVLVEEATRANVRATVRALLDRSPVLSRDTGLRVVGAMYSLATGVVELLDGAGTANG